MIILQYPVIQYVTKTWSFKRDPVQTAMISYLYPYEFFITKIQSLLVLSDPHDSTHRGSGSSLKKSKSSGSAINKCPRGNSSLHLPVQV
jgi:hypothetical protein